MPVIPRGLEKRVVLETAKADWDSDGPALFAR